MKLLGYDLDKMQGSKYINEMVYKPRAKIESSRLAPQFEVVSGLKCIVDKVRIGKKSHFVVFMHHFQLPSLWVA